MDAMIMLVLISYMVIGGVMVIVRKRQLNPSVCPSHSRPGDFRMSTLSLSC